MTDKKVVHYDRNKPVLQGPSNCVLIWPIDHPDTEWVSNASYVLTSPVVDIDLESGIIETENTIYKPQQ